MVIYVPTGGGIQAKLLILAAMRKTMLSLGFCFLFAIAGFAQEAKLPAVYQSESELSQLYQFNDEQRDKLSIILANRDANLVAIEDLLETDEPRFWEKRKAIYQGYRNSLEMLLNNKTQDRVFASQKTADRKAESDLIKQYLAEGYNRKEARLQLLRSRY